MPLDFIGNVVRLPGDLIGGFLNPGGGGGGGGGGGFQPPPPPPPSMDSELLLIGLGVLALVVILK